MAHGSVYMDIKKMERLAETLKTKAVIQVGVFADKTARKSGKMTNAALAQIHELGSPEHGLPARSMLRIPIHDHAQEIMKPFIGKAEAFLAKGTLLQLYKKIGVACENVVLGAFTTGGYGKWPSLTYKTLMAKLKGSLAKRKSKIGQMYAGEIGEGILIRSGALRRAFSSRVRMTY